MRFLSITFLCVLAGCSGRSEQPKLTYVPFAGQGQSSVQMMVAPNGGMSPVQNVPVQNNIGGMTMVQTCPCTCPITAPVQMAIPAASVMPTVPAVQEAPKTAADYLLPKEDYYPTQPSVIEAPMQSSDSIVILQHSVQRDLVKCMASDLRCISGYELQGYVQLSKTPSVPVAVEQKYDVLDGKWSDSTNVPRW